MVNDLTNYKGTVMVKKATNSELMKENNKKLILRLIMTEKYSRADIAKATGLTKAAVSIITEDLLSCGIIIETESDYTGVGRRPTILSINKDRFFAVGVNITRKNYEVGILNLSGEVIISEKKIFSDKPKSLILDEICKTINSQISSCAIPRSDILGIGITSPGPVDYKNLKILTPPGFEAWHNTDIGYIKEKFDDINVNLENVSNAHALYEKYYGKCTKSANYMTVFIDRDGIGAGIVVNDALYRGASGLSNEFGHTTIDMNGKKCMCGACGCLERYASSYEILSGTEYSSWQEAVDTNDTDLISREAQYLSAALISTVNLLDIDTVIISGDMAYKGKTLCELIEKNLICRTISKKKVPVFCSSGNSSVSVAASIIINDFFN